MQAQPLLIGQSQDIQFKLVAESIQNKYPHSITIDVDSPPEFSFCLEPRGGFSLRIQEEYYTPSLLWVRFKFPNISIRERHGYSPIAVARREWIGFGAGLSALYTSLNSPLITPSQSKIWQLHMAAVAGFRVPASHIGVGKSGALAFAAGLGDVALKAISSTHIDVEYSSDPEPFFTRRLSFEELEAADPSEFEACPVWLQEIVPNNIELRVIALEGKTTVYQTIERSNVSPPLDRRMLRPGYRLIPTAQKLHRFAQRYLTLSGLSYGVMDIIAHNGEFYFLECNEEGQWHSATGINVEEIVDAFSQLFKFIDRPKLE